MKVEIFLVLIMVFLFQSCYVMVERQGKEQVQEQKASNVCSFLSVAVNLQAVFKDVKTKRFLQKNDISVYHADAHGLGGFKNPEDLSRELEKCPDLKTKWLAILFQKEAFFFRKDSTFKIGY